MPVGKPKIEIDVAHSYDSIVVLDHIKFDVYENEFLCILGPSGCGKTTVLNIIAGFQMPNRGEVLVNVFLLHPGDDQQDGCRI